MSHATSLLKMASLFQKLAEEEQKEVAEEEPEHKISREELIEKLADLEHDRWSRWELWRTRKEKTEEDEKRWEVQRKTPYTELSEKEKDSDRKEALKTIELLESLGIKL